MKDWNEPTTEEKLDRIAEALCIQARLIEELRRHTHCGEMPGYLVSYVKVNPEYEAKYWGIKRGAK